MEMTARRLRSYAGERADLIAMLPEVSSAGLPVLDVGCSTGATGRALKGQLGVSVIGIDLDPAVAREASAQLDRVLVGDAPECMRLLVDEDVHVAAVIFGDVLEHLVDPWSCVDLSQALMPEGGWIVASIPNVAHLDTFLNLLRGTWPMRDRGIHDDTHLRFFAHKDIPGLLGRGRSSVVDTRRVYRIVERPHRVNRRAHLIGWVWPNLFTFQYRVLAHVRPLSRD